MPGGFGASNGNGNVCTSAMLIVGAKPNDSRSVIWYDAVGASCRIPSREYMRPKPTGGGMNSGFEVLAG